MFLLVNKTGAFNFLANPVALKLSGKLSPLAKINVSLFLKPFLATSKAVLYLSEPDHLSEPSMSTPTDFSPPIIVTFLSLANSGKSSLTNKTGLDCPVTAVVEYAPPLKASA